MKKNKKRTVKIFHNLATSFYRDRYFYMTTVIYFEYYVLPYLSMIISNFLYVNIILLIVAL